MSFDYEVFISDVVDCKNGTHLSSFTYFAWKSICWSKTDNFQNIDKVKLFYRKILDSLLLKISD